MTNKLKTRGRLDILQDMTDHAEEWRLELDLKSQPLAMLAIGWRLKASVRDRSKEFVDIRQAIDWIIEQVCENGS